MRASSLIDVLHGMGCTVKLMRADGREVTAHHDGCARHGEASEDGSIADELVLKLEADVPPPARLVAMLKARKHAVIHELRSPSLWSAEDWVAHFHERAAILEHDARLPRAHAEAEALQACFALWCGRRV